MHACPGLIAERSKARELTHDEDALQVPVVGHRRSNDAILGQRNHGTVIEHSQQHDENRGEVPAGPKHRRSKLHSASQTLEHSRKCSKEIIKTATHDTLDYLNISRNAAEKRPAGLQGKADTRTEVWPIHISPTCKLQGGAHQL